MSYFNINIDAIDNMIAEYKTLRETLKSCGDVLSTAVVNLSCDNYAGEDADLLRDKWTIQHEDTIPTIAELLDGVISILEDSSNEYKECKSYCSNMINVFNDYKTVQYSADSMNGYALCDVDSIETAIEYENEIGEDACKNADDIANALEVVAGLNYGQSGLQSALKDLADENVKLTDYSVHAYQLRQYIQKMVEADDHLYDKFSALNGAFLFGFFKSSDKDKFIPTGYVLKDYSPEVIQAARILAKGNPTKAEEKFFDSICLDYKFNDNDTIFLISIMQKNEWDMYDAKMMSSMYKYGIDNQSTVILSAVFNALYINLGDASGFDINKISYKNGDLGMNFYLDSEKDGMAFYTLERVGHLQSLDELSNICVELDANTGELVLCFDSKYDLNGNRTGHPQNRLTFVDMNELISEDGANNLKCNMHFTDLEYTEYLSSICSDEDIEFVCSLAECKVGDITAYEAMFSKNPNGLTMASSSALAEYSLHLGEYGTKEFSDNFLVFSNSMLCKTYMPVHNTVSQKIAGVEYKEAFWTKIAPSYANVYFDFWETGCEQKAEAAKLEYLKDINGENRYNYEVKSTIETIVAAENIILDRRIPVADSNANLIFTKLTTNGFTQAYISCEYNYSWNEPVTIEAKICNEDSMSNFQQYKETMEQDINQWNRDMYAARLAYAGIKTFGGGSGEVIDFIKDTVTDTTNATKISSSYSLMTNVDIIEEPEYYTTYTERSVTYHPIKDDGKTSKLQGHISNVVSGATIAYDAFLRNKEYEMEYAGFRINELVENCGSTTWIEIDDPIVGFSEPQTVYIDTKDTWTVEGLLFVEAVENGYLSEDLDSKQIQACEKFITTARESGSEKYSDRVCDIAYGIVFGGINIQQTILDESISVEEWNEAQKLANSTLESVNQNGITDQKEQFSKDLWEEIK
ncbi:MAG: hypothetical protein MJ112_01725 [Lachnospiraceae bacterium]|nr:hypothetical protein [Lachnospiraceae bacterium]